MVRGKSQCNEDASAALINLVKKYDEEINNTNNGADGSKRRQAAWNAITEQQNSSFAMNFTPQQWKKKFYNVQTSLKQKFSTEKRLIFTFYSFILYFCSERKLTGGGIFDESKIASLTPAEEEYSKFFNHANINGISGATSTPLFSAGKELPFTMEQASKENENNIRKSKKLIILKKYM